MAAFVYLITEEPFEGETSGYSQNPPEWRMDANLKRGNPRNIYVAAAFEFVTNVEARAAEAAAHEYFQAAKH